MIKLPAQFKKIPLVLGSLAVLASLSYLGYRAYQTIQQYIKTNQNLNTQLVSLNQEYETLKNEDQRKKNIDLNNTINQIKSTYKSSISVYELLQDLKLISKNTSKFDSAYAQIVNLLAQENYSSATDKLSQLNKDILAEKEKATTPPAGGSVTGPTVPTTNVPQNNAPPSSGYSRQTVSTPVGNFVVSMVAADLSNTRVIVDTSYPNDCRNDCPVSSLADFVSRNGAYAGVNGSYFCPATYPSCAGKTNTFDFLVMNKDKHYFNSDMNVYSTNPGVIFGGSYIRFVSAVSQWGRDTGIDSMLSNYPLLVEGGNVRFGPEGDGAYGGKGNRSFVANQGNRVFIGVAHSVTMSESAQVMKALNMENALNLDDGGSTALWSGGYKVGPGRGLPNAILFVNK